MSGRGRHRYFCENCGAEVPLQAKRCPGCGRFFESVRCPACGFTGEESRFVKGCPVCGHAVTGAAQHSRGNGRGRPPPLPLWIYLVSAAALAGVFALLFFRLV